ncbi:MAG: diphosphomevalonate decarboxylase, partial [Gammaproteobacteria bacterium]
MKWQASAPSNIALIKYMGKADTQSNTAINDSLSFTLNHLYTRVELEITDNKKDQWQALEGTDLYPIVLNSQSQARFLQHLNFLKQHFNFNQNFMVRSGNNFPVSAGLASSASSFAALTQCATQAICELQQRETLPPATLAQLSQQGSGSSCRSFFSP